MNKFLFFTLLLLNLSLFSQQNLTKNFYVVIADTSHKYSHLENKMQMLSKELDLKINLLGRVFNEEKNLICLPDTSSDIVFKNQYYPRRFSDNYLSIEYPYFYDDKLFKDEKLMALVTTIAEDRFIARMNLKKIRKYHPKAFIIQAEIYTGCLH